MSDITANVLIAMPSQPFTMARFFKAVANGKIFVGQVDTDPTNPANQIQVYIENEDGTYVPVPQPLRINSGGLPVYGGQIVKFVTVQNHSMAVLDAYNVQQFYFNDILKYAPDQLRAGLSGKGGGNIPGWYDATSAVRASNHKTSSNTWQDAVNAARQEAGYEHPVIIGADATGVETVPIQYAIDSGVTGFHLTQGTASNPSSDKRPIMLLEKVCDSGTSSPPHTMANFSMSYMGGVKGAIPLSTYVEAKGASAGGAIAIQTRARLLSATSSGWGGWSYIDVAGVLPVRAIGHEINVRCNMPNPLTWSASGGEVDGLVVATVDNGSNNMAHSAIKVSRSSQGLGFLSGLRIGYRSIIPSDTSDMTKLNGEAILVNGGSNSTEQYGGIRIGANDGAGFTRFHYGLRLNDAQFNNNVAIWLGDNQRLRWGAQLSSGPYLHYNATDFEFVGAALNVVNGSGSALKLNNTKVLGPRVTGIFALTGTADGAAKNTETVTLPELARYVKKGFDALIAHGLISPT